MSGFEIENDKSWGEALENGSTYDIIGGNCQILNVALVPGDKIDCEPGCLMHMGADITPYTYFACSCAKACSGEGQWSTQFKYTGKEAHQFVGLTANQPGKIIPIHLADTGPIICTQGAWMASLGDVKIDFTTACCQGGCNCNCCRCCFGGQGLVQQKLSGEGIAFLVGCGTIMMKTLKPGEKIVVDQDSVLAWSTNVAFKIRTAGGCCVCCCSGEGMFNVVLDGGETGGVVVLDSMPFQKYKNSIAPPQAQRGGGGGGEDGGAPALEITDLTLPEEGAVENGGAIEIER